MKQNTFNQPMKQISPCLSVAIEWTPVGFNSSTRNYDRVEGLS
jgi:hypothetical protein